MRTTRAVIENHLRAFGERDVEALLADYAPEALFFTPQGTLRGPAGIRPLLEGLVAEFSTPGARFALDHIAVEGENGFIVWNGTTAGNAYELATDTFVVRDGRIVVQTFAGRIVPRA